MESSQHQDHLISHEVQQSQDVLQSQENEQPQDLKHIDAPVSSSGRIPSPRGDPVSQESEKLPTNNDNDRKNKELVSSQVKEPDQPSFLSDQAESMNRPEQARRDNDTLVVNGCQLIRSSLDCPPYLTSGHLSANLDLGLISSDGHLVLVNKLCFAVHSTYAQALCCDISADQADTITTEIPRDVLMSIATFLTSGMIPLPFNRSTLEGFYALGIDIGKVKFAKIRAKRHHDLEVSVHRISEVHGISLTKTQIMAVSNRLRNFNNIMIVSKSTRPAPVPKPSKPAKKKKLPPTSKDSAGAGSAPKRKRIEYLSKKEYYSDYFDEDVGGPSRDSIWNNQQDFDAALTQVMHPKGKTQTCVHCGNCFADKPLLDKHTKYQGPFHSNKCVQCPATFQDHDGHKQHVTEVHNGVWRYICGMCDSIFDTIMDQREHRRTAHTHFRYKLCPDCGKHVSDLGQHIAANHPKESHPCSHCGKVCASVQQLQKHIETHTRPYICDTCGKGLGSSSQLRQHKIKNHMNEHEKPLHCSYCPKGFANNYDKRMHENTHTAAFPYACKHCGKKYNAPTNWAQHEKKCGAAAATIAGTQQQQLPQSNSSSSSKKGSGTAATFPM